MDLFKKIATYALIGITSIGLFGCNKKEDPQQRPKKQAPTEIVSPYVFNKSKILYNNLQDIDWSRSIGVTCGDLDGDGDLEIIVATKEGLIIYENKTEQKK